MPRDEGSYPESLPFDPYALLPHLLQQPARYVGNTLSSLASMGSPGTVYGGPVSGGTGISLADLIPKSKAEVGLTLAGMIPGGKVAKAIRAVRPETLAEAEAAVTKLPALKDNYLKPLSEYTPTLYRETNLTGVHDFLPGTAGSLNDLHVSNVPHLALGQGTNKGVLVEMNSGALQGQVNTRKPTWQPLWDQGQAEFLVRYPEREALQSSVRSITVKPGAEGSAGEIRRFKRIVQDWQKQENPDGSITYTKPRE